MTNIERNQIIRAALLFILDHSNDAIEEYSRFTKEEIRDVLIYEDDFNKRIDLYIDKTLPSLEQLQQEFPKNIKCPYSKIHTKDVDIDQTGYTLSRLTNVYKCTCGTVFEWVGEHGYKILVQPRWVE